MKKNNFLIIAFIAVTSFTGNLSAQESAKATGYDLKKNVKCRVSTTETGCVITFEDNTKAPRDVATGQSSGKRQHGVIRCYAVSSSDNAVAEIKSPRDAASGQASGKRTAQPSTTTSEDGMDAGKVSMQDFHFVITNKGKSREITSMDGECDLPSDLANGEYTLSVSWSWGATNSGSMSSGSGSGGKAAKHCSVDFLLEIEEGVYMAINEKGLPGEKGTKKGTK